MQSLLAPASRITQRPFSVGHTGESAARRIPLIRPATTEATVSRAPVFPAETKASPPVPRSLAPTMMDESLARSTLAGASLMP